MSPSTGAHLPEPPKLDSYQEVYDSADFQDLRRGFRSFIFPLTGAFLAWYFLYVLLAAFAPGFMATKLVGNINVGLIFGLLQFVTTFVITMTYRRWANQKFDPAAQHMRERIEGVAP